MRDFGGRAMCPRDEYRDRMIREEMVWHALEEALLDAGLRLPSEGQTFCRVYEAKPWDVLGLGCELAVLVPRGAVVTFRATTDDHLGEDASGLVDLTATLVTA